MNIACWTLVSSIATISAVIDEDKKIVETDNILALDYVGEKLSVLVDWLREYGEIRWEREDLRTGHVGRGIIKERK